MQKETPKGFHSWFGIPLTIAADARFSGEQIREFLEIHGIETRPVICGNIAKQPAIKRYPHRVFGELENATRVMTDSFAIASHQDVSAQAIEYVADTIETFLRSQ
jgi:CDP-6-deoxy-D-xylo-4-hexulose-3-dehydrase